MSDELPFIYYSPAEFEPGSKFDDSRPRFSGRGLRAIVRNAVAGALSGDGAGPVTFDVVVADSEGLVADGADFIAALFWIMTAAGYEEKTRSFICSVIGHLDRDALEGDGALLVDDDLAEMLGCCTKTVQRKRGEYLEEEAGLRFSVLRIDEGDFDHATRKNGPTSYRFLIGADVARAVQLARGSALWERDSRGAIREAAFKVFGDIEEAPTARRKRRKKTRSIESEIEALRKTIKTKLAKLRDLERKRRTGDVSKLWEGLRGELEEIVNAQQFGQIVEEAGDDPTGGQIVQAPAAAWGLEEPAAAAQAPDIYVPAEVANDEESIRRCYAEQGYVCDEEVTADEGGEGEESAGDRGRGRGPLEAAPTPQYLTAREVAEMLRLSPKTIHNMASRRRIPFRKAGGRLLFDLAEIEAWVREGADNP